PARAPAAAKTGEGDGAPVEEDRAGFYSPVVRRIADKHGIDLTEVEGTGIGGRIRKRDVLAFIEAGGPPTRASGARGGSRCRRCGRRSPSTWSPAAARRRTARPSSRPTSRGFPPGGGS